MAPFPGSLGQFFWSGMAGTFFWIDPAEDMFAVFMMQAPSFLAEAGHAGHDPSGEPHRVPLANPFRGTAQHVPDPCRGLPDEEELDLRFAARSPEPRRKDPGVVENEKIARAHELPEFPERAMPARLRYDANHCTSGLFANGGMDRRRSTPAKRSMSLRVTDHSRSRFERAGAMEPRRLM